MLQTEKEVMTIKEECNLGYTKLGECIQCLYGSIENYQTQKGDDE